MGRRHAGAVVAAPRRFLFVLAGDPERLGRTMTRLEQVLPSKLAQPSSPESPRKFRPRPGCHSPAGAAARRAGLVVSLVAVDRPRHLGRRDGFRLAVPFTGSFLLMALLVIGVAVPTPGAIGGFHEAFRVGATMFYGAPDDAAVGAAIVLHLSRSARRCCSVCSSRRRRGSAWRACGACPSGRGARRRPVTR